MDTQQTISWKPLFRLDRLTGPIFDKELRIASRRKRYYLLRMAFIAVLLIFIFQAWFMTMTFSHSQSPAFVSFRMSNVSRGVVCAVAWLEFISLPLLAALMMSNALPQEINKRTLDVLLTSPISALQIVTGKFFSCLLQIVLLVGLTLPLFAIIRVFGGVPWDFTLISLGITLLTTGLFAAVSLLYSTRTGRSYQVLTRTVVTALLVFLILPIGFISLHSWKSWVWSAKVLYALNVINPYVIMGRLTESLLDSNPQGMSAVAWLAHTYWVAGAFVIILILSIWNIRKRLLAMANNQMSPGRLTALMNRLFKKKKKSTDSREMLDIAGHPVYWKEMHRSEPGMVFDPKSELIGMFILLFIVYFCAGYLGALMETAFHAVLVTILSILAFLRIGILSALSISSEKQSRTWPILLTTPLTEEDIVKMKVKAILRKTATYWIIIFADVLVFSCLLVINPFAIIGVAIAIITTVLFLLGVGFYFGMRLKTTTQTLAVTFLVPMALWIFCPCFLQFSPVALIAMSVAVGWDKGALWTIGILGGMSLIPAAVYSAVGIVLLVLTKSSMRKYAFNLPG